MRLADDDLFYVRGKDRGGLVTVDVVVAAGLERLHQRALAGVPPRDDGQRRVLGVGPDDSCDFQAAHLTQSRCAKYCCWHVIFERSERESCLRARDDFESFSFQRIAQALRKIHVAVNQQNFSWTPGRSHGRASSRCVVSTSAGDSPGPGVMASIFNTSITSPA